MLPVSISETATYIITFLAVYVQLFMLVTFLEKRNDLKKAATEAIKLTRYPTVGIVVPCWNEETTIHGTVESLLSMHYPKDKLQVILVDDGSTDTTWKEILKYEHHPQVKIFQKENGGKHTAVNWGIEHTNTELVGCLDADSFVAPDALERIVYTFQQDKDVMAVAPSIIIFKPKTFLQRVQKIEYNMGVYVKKMLAFLGAIHVTPGPFSIFRRTVFEKLGGFRKAHNTEDMEIAYRMQENHMKIDHCYTAHVYTVAPDTIRKLYKQRLRWIYGFIQNTIDYKHLIFKKSHGNFSFFTLPAGVISIIAAVYIFFSALFHIINWIIHRVELLRTVGVQSSSVSFSSVKIDWFFMNTQTIMFTTVALYLMLIIAMIAGTRMAKQKLNFHIISYVIVYSIVAPFWLMKAIWNSIIAKKPSWR
jgi:cellulose synthase/poly-beta-1,6-N-acetylglucosamine synthase-like glycosyltransferase